MSKKTNQTLRKYIKKYLGQKEPQATGELLNQYNEDNNWGATMNQIGNILSRDSSFFTDGTIDVCDQGQRVRQSLWYLSETED
jgi:hypothetical protein